MRLCFIFLFFIFFISFACAIEITITPPQINFEGFSNEEICEKIRISVNEEVTLIGEDRWAQKEFMQRDFLKHNFSSEELELEIYYLDNFKIQGEKEIKICLKGKEEGNYHGILLFRAEENPAGVGTWINVSLTQSEGSLSKITGAVVGGGSSGISLTIVFILLLVIAFILIKDYKKSKSFNS